MNGISLSRHKATGQFWPMRQNTKLLEELDLLNKICGEWVLQYLYIRGKMGEKRQRMKRPFFPSFFFFFALFFLVFWLQQVKEPRYHSQKIHIHNKSKNMKQGRKESVVFLEGRILHCSKSHSNRSRYRGWCLPIDRETGVVGCSV